MANEKRSPVMEAFFIFILLNIGSANSRFELRTFIVCVEVVSIIKT